jgi:hypothetical protein
MAKLYITEHEFPRYFLGSPIPVLKSPPLVSQTVAIAGASAQSSAFNASTKIIAVHTDAICSIEFGSNPTATANSRRLAANSTEYFEVDAATKIAVITNT